MTTPTAVCTTWKILHDKVNFDAIKFIDQPEFDTEYEKKKLYCLLDVLLMMKETQ